jgi:hypothetical protein
VAIASAITVGILLAIDDGNHRRKSPLAITGDQRRWRRLPKVEAILSGR